MGWLERMAEVGGNVLLAVLGAMASGIAWLVRTVLTNRQQIALLEQEIRHRAELREADRAALADVRERVSEIQALLMGGRGRE